MAVPRVVNTNTTVNGSVTAASFNGVQLDGMSKTYTISATGYKTIAQVSSASQYWTVNGGNSAIRLKIEYSSLSSPASTATTTKLGTWIVDVAFSGINASMFVVSMNGNAGNENGVLRYLAAYAPKTTSYNPKICVANYSTTSTYVKVTILSCTAGWELPASFGGDPGTTNYTRFGAWEVGRYNYTWSNNKIYGNITGSCDGTAGWANGTWDRIDDEKHKAGATVVWYNKGTATSATTYGIVSARSIGLGSDGLAYHLAKPDQTFQLPFIGGRAYTTYAVSNTAVRIEYQVRGVATTELTNTNVANTADLSASTTYTGTGTAYAYNWLFRTHTNSTTWTDATSLTIGKNIYVCGNLDSSGNFKPYYTSATGQTVSVPKGQGGFTEATNVTMQKYTFYITQNPTYTANYNTFLYIGKAEASTTAFTYMCMMARAYTLNSSGKLTHIDGRPIQNASGTIVSSAGIQATGMDGYAQFRAVFGNYGYMIRNDGSNTYGLMTASGDAYGTWTTARPWTIANSTGVMSINGSAAKVSATLGTTTKAYLLGTTLTANGTTTPIFDTGVYLDTTAGKLTATTFAGALTGNVTGNCSGSAGSVAYANITSNPFGATDVTITEVD